MNTKEHGRFEGYAGTQMYLVNHPNYGTVNIASPSSTAAIIVAAKLWDENWQNPVFFSACKCSNLSHSGRWVAG